MVIAPASTGSDNSKRNTVTRIDHTNSGILCRVMPGARMLKIVVMKLMAPRIDEAPARCSERIAKSTAGPGWPVVDSGAYIVQPAPTPLAPGSPSKKVEISSSANEAGSSQNEMLFMRGNAMSGAPIISGTIQLPKPPIIAGITMKKIMIAVRGGEHVVQMRGVLAVEELHAGIHQLDAHADRERAADHPADDREHQVHRADVLVVGRVDEAAPSGRGRMIVRIMRVVSRCRSHDRISLTSKTRCRPLSFIRLFSCRDAILHRVLR